MAPVPNPNNDGDACGGAKRDEATEKKVHSSKNQKKKDVKEDEDLSEEDLELKQNLELYAERVQDPNPELQKAALESLSQEIRASASSMTLVRKPLKFLRPHYETLKGFHKTMVESDLKKLLANILSVLAMSSSDKSRRECLRYRLIGSRDDIGSWGHEYVRSLAGKIPEEYEIQLILRGENAVKALKDVAQQIVAFNMKHNAEAEAVDLLIEVEDSNRLLEHVDSTNFRRTCNYLKSVAKYCLGPDDAMFLEFAYKIYLKFAEYPNALQIALRLDDMPSVKRVFTSCTDLLNKKQFCYMISRHGITFKLDAEMVANNNDRKMLQDIVNNTKLSEGYLILARDVDVMEPKTPEDIYKAHLLDERGRAAVNGGLANLAAAFVNAFVNAGFGQEDGLMKDSLSAAASVGMIFLWNVDAVGQFDKYYQSKDNLVLAGALLGTGILNCGIKCDNDPALSLLEKYIEKGDPFVRIGAIMGLGIAYAGSRNDEIRGILSPILNDAKAPLDVIAFAALSLGIIFVGSCNEEIEESIIFAITHRSEAELDEALTRFLPLGLGLLYLGRQETVDDTMEMKVMKTLNVKIREYCDTTLLSCAFAGIGRVLEVKDLLARCDTRLGRGDIHQGPAVLGLAMVAMSEELGTDMGIRILERMLQYGEQNIRRAVPLALGLLCISNPKVNVMDTLSRLSHDRDFQVALGAIISLGLIGAGTNNARIAGMLRNLSSYHYKYPSLVFCVRIAQGLVHMGKGLLTLNPFHSHRVLLSPTALAGIVTFLHTCLDMKAFILGKYHFVIYFLVLAIQPRMMITVDKNLKPISVPVRVGKAVDVVGQAGRPKTITGWQTHLTPVILAAGERAELASDKYIPLSPILEGFIILKENPDYRKE